MLEPSHDKGLTDVRGRAESPLGGPPAGGHALPADDGNALIDELRGRQFEIDRDVPRRGDASSPMSGVREALSVVLGPPGFEAATWRLFDDCRHRLGAIAGYVTLLSPGPGGAIEERLVVESGGAPRNGDPSTPTAALELRDLASSDGRTVYENHISLDEWPGLMPEGQIAIHNMLLAPMSLNGSTAGLMCYVNKPGGFGEDDAALAEVYAGLAALALDRKRRQAALEQTEERLRQSQHLEAIGALAGGIAHDFNNILTAVLGHTQLAMRDVDSGSRTHQNLETVAAATLRATDLVRQILTVARQQEQPNAPTLVQSVIKEAIRLLRATIPSTIEVRTSVDANCSPVFSDFTRIHQLVMNLCANGYHAMREHGGTLEVGLAEVDIDPVMAMTNEDLKPGRYARVSVRDDGHGMDEDTRRRIFEPYFTTKARGEGTGLGLATALEIVKQHRGTITVDSQVGQGTCFQVFLPVCSKPVLRNDSKPDDDVLPVGNERILFVDDEEVIAELWRDVLKDLGYTVTAHTDSESALELFLAAPDEFDLVITDFTMPRMTGLDIASAMLRLRPELPIILCTGYSELVDEETAKAAGVQEFLMKPVSDRDFALAIRRVLD